MLHDWEDTTQLQFSGPVTVVDYGVMLSRLQGRDGHEVWRYLADNFIWVWLSLAALSASVTFFITPDALDNSSIGVIAHPYDYLWNLMFGLAGFFIFFGMLSRRPGFETLGLIWLAGGLVVLELASLAYVGVTPAAFTFPALILAAMFRAKMMLRVAATNRAHRLGREQQ